MKAELRKWCEKNSQIVTKFKHLCIKVEKYPRGKKINITTPKFLEHLEELSQCRPDISVSLHRLPEEMKVKKSALKYKITKHTRNLSAPLNRQNPEPYYPNKIKPNALKHKTTAREEMLATPPKRRDPPYRAVPTQVSQAAKEAEASERIKQLAKVPKSKQGKKWKPEKPVYVKKSALSATASARTNEMANPRQREDKSTKKHPYDVRKGALKYELTDRTKDLAQPKKPIHQKYKNPEDEWKYRFDRDINDGGTEKSKG